MAGEKEVGYKVYATPARKFNKPKLLTPLHFFHWKLSGICKTALSFLCKGVERWCPGPFTHISDGLLGY
jgi:hypothetical protein